MTNGNFEMWTPALTREQVRDVDRRAVDEYGMCGLVLMENAGRGCVDVLCRIGVAGPVAICCGRGNNGGDGFVIARHLELRGFVVRVLLWTDPAELRGDALANYSILTKADVPIHLFDNRHDPGRLTELLRDADWIVDALLGTGSRGAPRPPLDAVIDQLNATATKRLAVDLPSGLDCDTGQPAQHTLRADHTCTFVAAKVGFSNPAARAFVGQLHVLDIGAPRKLVDQVLAATNNAATSRNESNRNT